MILLNTYITEKLRLKRDIDTSIHQTDEVIALQSTSVIAGQFDLSLIITALENMYKESKINDIEFSIEYSKGERGYYMLYENSSTQVIRYIVKNGNVNFKLGLYASKEITQTPNSVKLFMDVLSSKRAKGKPIIFSKSNVILTYHWFYMWVSDADNVIKMMLSDRSYETLTKENTFI